MIIDYTKGYFITEPEDRKRRHVRYIDDLAYHLYMERYNPMFTQYGFMSTFKDRHEFYEKAELIIRKEKINNIKKRLHG